MNEELISKKDLLELMGISYGQLYRWKRKNLIPEGWFIRKSTFTGQETFFPKDKILDRIKKIQTMKETLSLDELADMFSPNATDLVLSKEEILKKNVVSEAVLNIYLEIKGVDLVEFSYQKILHIYVLESLLQSGQINLEEGKMILQVLQNHPELINQKSSMLIIARKLGISTCIFMAGTEEIHFENGTKVIAELSLSNYIEELKTKLL